MAETPIPAGVYWNADASNFYSAATNTGMGVEFFDLWEPCKARFPQSADDCAVAAEANGWEWAIVEIFGHRKHAGRVREEERFGAKMLRIDVPVKGDAGANGWETHWYGGSSIFSLALIDEATAMRANKPYEAPSRYSLPRPDDHSDDDFED